MSMSIDGDFENRDTERMARALACDAPAPDGLVSTINKSDKNFFDVFVVQKIQSRCTRLRKNLGVAAKCLTQEPGQAWMLTLTYRGVSDWKPYHISECIDFMRKYFLRAYRYKLRYLWVMELQKRGAPHYHLIVWLPAGVSQAELHCDKLGWWSHGMTNVLKANAPVKYVMKYASKFDSEGCFPKGARVYGIGGLDICQRKIRRWINLPSAVKHRGSVDCTWKRAKGGGWINHDTGEFLQSEFALVYRNKSSVGVKKIIDHGRPMGDLCGPYSYFGGESSAISCH